MKSLTKKRQLLNLGNVDLRKYYHGIIINLFLLLAVIITTNLELFSEFSI